MTFKTHSDSKIAHLHDQASRLAAALEKLREEMKVDQATTAELQLGKAEHYLNWLEEWAIDIEGEARKMAARRHVKQLRKDLEEEQKAKRGRK